MARRPSPDLHGNAPDESRAALLLIDVINDLEFEGGEHVLPAARRMAPRLAALKRRLKRAGIPAIYVNDNFGRWRSDFQAQLRHCLGDGVRGRDVVARLVPEDDDYFVLKPKHSGFYATGLDLLLRHLGARRLVVTGIATDNCVLFTAADAYLRDYEVHVPPDCAAPTRAGRDKPALRILETTLKADLTDSRALRVRRLARP